ncbi:MAG TPA: hypothetical protein VK689_20365, partial [Armatimonadota bacterium]|nr:hypothetical protein [Armatimonadota bacterium]
AISLLDSGNGGLIPVSETRQTLEGLAHGNLAAALAGQLRFAEAGPEAEKALAVYPDHPGAAILRKIAEVARESAANGAASKDR